jgi:DNA-binding winged helix-turn-helix (wHTH) protein
MPVLSFPPFRLDPVDERLSKDGVELKLRRKPFAILKYLVQNPKRLVTQDELIEAVWGKVVMSESLLRTHVRDVRSVVGDSVIETVIGRGYRFVPDVREEASRQAPQPTLASSLVGRNDELAVLRAHLDTALERKRQLVFVTGAAGIGKTALVDALLEHAIAAGASVARGVCVEQYGSGEAFLPVLSALATLCRAKRGDRVVDILKRHAPTWLLQMPGLVADGDLGALQARVQGATQARLLRELTEALELLSIEVPIAIALDDLQWADHSTIELLAMLGRRREPARLLVVGTCRHLELGRTDALKNVLGELTAHRQAATRVLEPLSEAAVGEYLEARWPRHCSPNVVQAIYEGSGGNPMFMVALLDDLEARRMVRLIDGAWQLFATMGDIRAHRPDSIRQLIDIQIDRLAPPHQRMLEAASACGLEFAVGAVAHALETSVDDVENGCEGLAEQGRFVRYMGTDAWPDGTLQARYAFVHDLYRDAASTRASSSATRLAHRRIGERLETAYGDAVDTIAAELAVHFDAAQCTEKAIHYYELAGLRAENRSGGVETLAHYQRARDLLPRLPATRDRDRIELTIVKRLGRAAIAATGLQSVELVPAFTRAAELARELRDDASLGAALVGLQQARMLRGAFREIEAHVVELAEVSTRISDPVIGNWGTLMAAAAKLHRGHPVDARRQLADVANSIGRAPSVAPGSDAPSFPYGPLLFSNLAVAEWLIGRPDAALARALDSVALAESLGDPFTLSLGLAAAATVHGWRRDPASALAFARRGMQVSSDAGAGLGLTRAAVVFYLASAELDQMPAANALAELDKVLSVNAASRAGKTGSALAVIELATRAGQFERGLAEIVEMLAYAEQYDERAWEPELHRVRGELLSKAEPVAAKSSFNRALELARGQGSRSLELRAALSLHRTASRSDKPASLEVVRRIRQAFSEGATTGDLIEAARLLEQATV